MCNNFLFTCLCYSTLDNLKKTISINCDAKFMKSLVFKSFTKFI